MVPPRPGSFALTRAGATHFAPACVLRRRLTREAQYVPIFVWQGRAGRRFDAVTMARNPSRRAAFVLVRAGRFGTRKRAEMVAGARAGDVSARLSSTRL